MNFIQKYLKDHRVIITDLSSDIRTTGIYERSKKGYLPALIVYARDKDGNVTPLLYSQHTKDLLTNIDSIEVDKIKVKGKEELITIYSPVSTISASKPG